jgi:hypothetical protein
VVVEQEHLHLITDLVTDLITTCPVAAVVSLHRRRTMSSGRRRYCHDST